MAGGRPSKYQPAYCEEVVNFCAEGYSLTAFAGEIGVDRDSITEWAKVYPEFSLAVKRAKAKRARWWEDRGRKIAEEGGPGGQATMVIFGLKNHAPDDYSDKVQHEHSGPNGGPIDIAVRQQRAAEMIDAAFSEVQALPGSEVTEALAPEN